VSITTRTWATVNNWVRWYDTSWRAANSCDEIVTNP
jgi:hypothetical protein